MISKVTFHCEENSNLKHEIFFSEMFLPYGLCPVMAFNQSFMKFQPEPSTACH